MHGPFSPAPSTMTALLAATMTTLSRRFFSASSTGGGPNSNSGASFSAKQPALWGEQFRRVPKEQRNKQEFLKCIELFRKSRGKRGAGHVEFIEAAKKQLKAYNLHRDMDVYKALLDVFPKGELQPKNVWQRMYWHFPQQQVCAIDLLDEMEWNGVEPDKELHDLMVSIFGDWNHATKKVKRQLYWKPKLKHTNKYLDRRLVEGKTLQKVELAHLALRMICRDAGTQLSSFKAYFAEVEGPAELTNWIVSGQSPLQRRHIANLAEGTTCHVDGPYRLWVREHMLTYVMLSSAATVSQDEEFVPQITAFKHGSREEMHRRLWEVCSEQKPNLHQQADATILALAIFGQNSNEFASAWINHLQAENPQLRHLSVLFRLREIRRSLEPINNSDNNSDDQQQQKEA